MPRWAYRPGIGEPDRETLERTKELVPSRYAHCVPSDDCALAYGLALNDAGFFWECHEILEAIWKLAPQGGCDRILLRACIQTANGNLKAKMRQTRAASRLFAEAALAVDELGRRDKNAGGFAAAYPATVLEVALTSPNPPIMLRLDLFRIMGAAQSLKSSAATCSSKLFSRGSSVGRIGRTKFGRLSRRTRRRSHLVNKKNRSRQYHT